MNNKSNSELVKDLIGQMQSQLNIQFFRGSNGLLYVSICYEGKERALPLSARNTKDFFHAYLRRQGYKVTSAFLEEVLEELNSLVVVNNEIRDVFIRIAPIAGGVIVDLADKEGNFVVITSEGITLQKASPVHFIHSLKQRPLPLPKEIDPFALAEKFKSFCNYKNKNAWIILMAALLKFLHRGTGAFPILIFEGPQGSGKTFTSNKVRMLIDPCDPPLSHPPKTIEDVVVLTVSSYLLAFDNLSGMTAEMADIFCRLATGAGYSKRILYTDADERSFQLFNPALFNGIDEPTSRPDFVERTLTIELNALDSKDRRPESSLKEEFQTEYPLLIGGLYHTLSACLRELPHVQLSELPRMADFARLGIALERVLKLPEGFFLETYSGLLQDQAETSFWNDAVCSQLHKHFFETNRSDGSLDIKNTEIRGTASELISKLFRKSRSEGFHQFVPKSPKEFSGRLKRAEPFLLKYGLIVERSRTSGRREIIIRLADSELIKYSKEDPYVEEDLGGL